jgi:hypothetical protein
MAEEELEVLRKSLKERLDSCWDRLMDVVSELHAVHDVSTDEILRRVEEAAEEDNEKNEGEGGVEVGGGS